MISLPLAMTFQLTCSSWMVIIIPFDSDKFLFLLFTLIAVKIIYIDSITIRKLGFQDEYLVMKVKIVTKGEYFITTNKSYQ